MRILFFSLIPLGVILLIFSIKSLHKSFSGNVILEIPYSQKSADFELRNHGIYSIWHKGQFFRKTPLDEFKPVITTKTTGKEISLSSHLFRPNTNNGKTARMEIFRFSAPAGNYLLELKEGSSISKKENSFIRQLPLKMVDHNKYYIEIRESQPRIFVLIGILMAVLSGLCIIGGLMFGIFSGQIFTD